MNSCVTKPNGIPPRLFGLIHRLVSPLDDARLRVIRPQVSQAGAEGDQDFLVVGEEEAFGEFAL